MFRRSHALCLSCLGWAAILCCQFVRAQAASDHSADPTPVVHVDNPANTLAQQAKHYVILVSLDGFRYDYPAKYGAPHLQAMAKDGASAPDGMLPSYPSLTFPNHLSIVTGLYPEHHGIVANSFFDPTLTPEQGQRYSYTDPKTNGDGSWYGGTPLWVLAEQQGMRSACLFWPGSEAEIQGKRPSYYLHYDDKLDDQKRVDQVIAWLSLPPELRPHFITLYYSNVDHAGHAYGPDSDEVRAAVHHVDDLIGDLQAKLAALKLPVDLIVIADHGMVTLQGDPIDLSQFADLTGVHTEGSLLYAKDEASAEKLYEQLKAHPDPRFDIYRRADVPKALHYDSNVREGDPVIVPNGPYPFRTKPETGAGAMSGTLHGGHGFDPRTMPEMKAIFFAEGPDIKPGVQLPSFNNVEVYPLIVDMLGLASQPVDGNRGALIPALSGSTILVGLRVDEKGNPTDIRVLRGVSGDLDQKAIEIVRKYHFKPSIKDGRPVATEIHIEVNIRKSP